MCRRFPVNPEYTRTRSYFVGEVGIQQHGFRRFGKGVGDLTQIETLEARYVGHAAIIPLSAESTDQLEMTAQNGLCLVQDIGAHQDVVGIEGGNRQDADAGFGKRIQDRGQDAYGGEFQFSFYREGPPSGLTLRHLGYISRWANDGELMGGAGYGYQRPR